jgi:hypothetical protein
MSSPNRPGFRMLLHSAAAPAGNFNSGLIRTFLITQSNREWVE